MLDFPVFEVLNGHFNFSRSTGITEVILTLTMGDESDELTVDIRRVLRRTGRTTLGSRCMMSVRMKVIQNFGSLGLGQLSSNDHYADDYATIDPMGSYTRRSLSSIPQIPSNSLVNLTEKRWTS